MEAFIVAIVSYLIGSIPFAVVVSRIFKLGDITKFGSGNPGATNMVRLGGKKLGALTFALDAAKGALVVWLADMLGYENLGFVAVIIGHCFSAFLKFKGGKGVATTLGGLSVLCFESAMVFAVVWVVAFAIFRISSVSALIAINVVMVLSLVFWYEYAYAILIVAILVSYRHKDNIKKLIGRGS